MERFNVFKDKKIWTENFLYKEDAVNHIKEQQKYHPNSNFTIQETVNCGGCGCNLEDLSEYYQIEEYCDDCI